MPTCNASITTAPSYPVHPPLNLVIEPRMTMAHSDLCLSALAFFLVLSVLFPCGVASWLCYYNQIALAAGRCGSLAPIDKLARAGPRKWCQSDLPRRAQSAEGINWLGACDPLMVLGALPWVALRLSRRHSTTSFASKRRPRTLLESSCQRD